MEGPSVKAVAEKLNDIFKGKTIKKAWGRTRNINFENLVDKEIEKIYSHGKNLLIKIKNLGFIKVHFLMYGSYSIDKITKDEKRIRLVIEANSKVYFYNCSVRFIKHFRASAKDILAEDWDPEKVLAKLKKRTGYICDILLDQSILPGVGNIIKNEALFASRIHPASRIEKIKEDKLKFMLIWMRDFCKIFYKSRKDGLKLLNFTMIYGKRNCLFCGNKIKIKRFGNLRRISYFCPRCQRLYQ